MYVELTLWKGISYFDVLTNVTNSMLLIWDIRTIVLHFHFGQGLSVIGHEGWAFSLDFHFLF